MKSSDQIVQKSFKTFLQGFWKDLVEALSTLPRWERGFHLFWLLGPFILLIERSPADIWLSVLALTFAVKTFLKRDGSWLRVFWVRACFLFLGVCLLSSAWSEMRSYAFSETLAWFRFPLFAMATVFWLGKDKRLLYAMLISTVLSMLLMTGILAAELIIEDQRSGRLSWPFGDYVSGNYLTKVSLPAFVAMVALAIGSRPRLASVMGGLAVISIGVSILTGERINFLIRFCGGMLAGLVWKPNWRRYIIFLIIQAAAIIAVSAGNLSVQSRFFDTVVSNVPTGPHSDYYRVMGAGLTVFKTAPVFGVGPALHRELCPTIVAKDSKFRCDNHPHNFYIQLLSETGVIGFFVGAIMIISIIWTTYAGRKKNRLNVLSSTAFITPLGLFFPIQFTGDFFGQWNNIFLWSAVALALAAAKTLQSDELS